MKMRDVAELYLPPENKNVIDDRPTWHALDRPMLTGGEGVGVGIGTI